MIQRWPLGKHEVYPLAGSAMPILRGQTSDKLVVDPRFLGQRRRLYFQAGRGQHWFVPLNATTCPYRLCQGEISGIGLLIARRNWAEMFANGLVVVT
jgi:hypothetical protein